VSDLRKPYEDPLILLLGATALVLMIAGAWCGGEMVYGKGVGVSR